MEKDSDNEPGRGVDEDSEDDIEGESADGEVSVRGNGSGDNNGEISVCGNDIGDDNRDVGVGGVDRKGSNVDVSVCGDGSGDGNGEVITHGDDSKDDGDEDGSRTRRFNLTSSLISTITTKGSSASFRTVAYRFNPDLYLNGSFLVSRVNDLKKGFKHNNELILEVRVTFRN